LQGLETLPGGIDIGPAADCAAEEHRCEAACSYTKSCLLCPTSPNDDEKGLSIKLQAHQPAVFVDKTTKVICQGFTGKNGTFHSEQVGDWHAWRWWLQLPVT
jgi:hypothetical protein